MRNFIRLSLIMVSLLTPTASWSDGILIPIRQPQRDAFSVKYHHVEVQIDGQAATTKVDQVFHNETDQEEEGTYVFPLPKGAAIHKFSMFIGEEEQQGKILDRDEARRLYESVVRSRKDPALLEYMGNGASQARVYPIPPNGDKRIRLDYTELVPKTGDMCRYVYPLSTERFSAKPLESVRITIYLKANVPITNVYSPSHIVDIEQKSPDRATVTWTAKNVKPDQDLILYYSLTNKDIALDVLAFKEEGERGYFMLLASPKVSEDEAELVPKNVVFLLDRTGSMAGDKIVQAKGALKYCLNSLSPHDHFNLITFNESPDPLWNTLKPASKENIDRAIDAVETLDASGGTNINSALLEALRMYTEKGGHNFIFFLTDGLPTVGERNVADILENAKKANHGNVRIFTFGVGYDVNAQLLDMLSGQSGGLPEYVLPTEDIESKVSSFFSKVGRPVLTDLTLTADGVRISELLPSNPLPDLFKGSQLIILGRYEGHGKAKFILSGTGAKGRRDWETAAEFPAADTDKDFIPQIWAARKIGYLLDEVRLHKSDELIKEIVELSKRWGIPTEFTSFLVQEPSMPLEEAALKAGDMLKRAREVPSGSWGVSQSVNTRALKDHSQVMASPTAAPLSPSADGYTHSRLGNARAYFDQEGKPVIVEGVQNIGARAFYQRGNQWVESRAEDNSLQTIRVKQFSNAHFKLLAAYPELNKYQRLGNIRLFLNGQALEIGPEGREDLTDTEIEQIVGRKKAGEELLMAGLHQKITSIPFIAIFPVLEALRRMKTHITS